MKEGNIKSWLTLVCIIVFNITNAQLCLLSDEFEDTVLDAEWQQFQSEYYDLELSSGQLTMDINASVCGSSCPWFHSQSAGFIYKTVVGDFELISIVNSEEASGSNSGDDISNDTQLGGLMARDGSTNFENYVFNVVGTRFDTPSVETKSTTNNISATIQAFPISTTRSELRMIRSQSNFYMYSRAIGAQDWVLRSTFNRPDLSDTLQVGVIAYAYQSFPEDLAVKFDYVRYSDLTSINSWLGGDGMWSDHTMWSLNEVPDSTHQVIIDNTQSQVIQILPSENFDCYSLDIDNNISQLNIEGQLNIKSKTTACE